MGIRLTDEGFFDLLDHVGHDIECVSYGDVGQDADVDEAVNAAIECITCGCVLVDFDRP